MTTTLGSLDLRKAFGNITIKDPIINAYKFYTWDKAGDGYITMYGETRKEAEYDLKKYIREHHNMYTGKVHYRLA